MRRKEYHDKTCNVSDAGWSSLVARRAHNPKVVGSNPAPATTFKALAFVGDFCIRRFPKIIIFPAWAETCPNCAQNYFVLQKN